LQVYIFYDLFVSISEDGYERNLDHKYIVYGEKPPVGFISQAAELVTKAYFDIVLPQPIKKWKKDKTTYKIKWTQQNSYAQMSSADLNYLIIAEELRKYGKFDCDKFNLQPIGCALTALTYPRSKFLLNSEKVK